MWQLVKTGKENLTKRQWKSLRKITPKQGNRTNTKNNNLKKLYWTQGDVNLHMKRMMEILYILIMVVVAWLCQNWFDRKVQYKEWILLFVNYTSIWKMIWNYILQD